MPSIILPTRDLYNSMDRPVMLGIIKELLEITNLSSQTRILFPGIEGKVAQVGSTIEHENEKLIGTNRWPYDEQIEIEIEEDYDTSRLLTTQVVGPEHEFVFWDDELGLYLKPVYSTNTVTINFKFRAVDKEKAMQWRNMMRTKVAQKREMLLHEVSYSYHIPEEFLIIAGEVYKLKENVAGDGIPPDKWFANKASDRVSKLSNMSGKSSIFAVAETQMRIQGVFQFEGVPEKGSREDGNDSWTISFGYKFNLDKPINFVVQYPYVVHNQLVPEKLILKQPYTIEGKDRRYSMTVGNLAYFESDQQALRSSGYEGVSIPPWDDWMPSTTTLSTIRLFTGLCLINENDKRTLLNLNELGDFAIHPKIIEFIKNAEYSFIGTNFNSIFSLTLYENKYIQSDTILSIDSNLNIIANVDLDLTKTYHVRFGLVTNIKLLPKEAIKRISGYESIDPYTGDLVSNVIPTTASNNGFLTLGTVVNTKPFIAPHFETSVITLAMLVVQSINHAIRNNAGTNSTIPKNKLTSTEVDELLGSIDVDTTRWNGTFTTEAVSIIAFKNPTHNKVVAN